MRKIWLVPVITVGTVALGGCFPKRDLPVSEIPSLKKLEEVMDVQATVADPQFKKIGQPSFSDSEWAALVDTGNRIQATSAKIKDFSRGADFDALAVRLGERAQALVQVATAHDAAGVSKALGEMKATCRECHKKFK